MFCPNCGNQIPDDSAFCPSCGAPMGRQQPQYQQPQYQQPQYQQPQYQQPQYQQPPYQQQPYQQPTQQYHYENQKPKKKMSIWKLALTCVLVVFLLNFCSALMEQL